MGDLFIRLAERALAETSRALEATTLPEPAPFAGDDEDVTVAAEPGSGTPTTARAEDQRPAATPTVGPRGRRGPTGEAGAAGHDRLVGARLVPVASVVPATPERPSSQAVSDPVEPTAAQGPSPGPVRTRPVPSAPVLRPAAPAPPPPVTVPPRTSDRTEPPAAPAVDVTVGRIEIHVRPPAPSTALHGDEPAARARPATPMTLEEYLRRREAAT
jgi:hypothetical protein